MKDFRVIIGIILVTLSSCDLANQKLSIVNTSRELIYYSCKMDSILTKNEGVYDIPPLTTDRPSVVRGLHDDVLAYEINKSQDSTLYVYIFKTSVLNDSLIANKEYEVKGWKVKDLENSNWTIKYPDDFQLSKK